VLAPIAERAEDIDVERARRALDAATELVATLGGSRSGSSDESGDVQVDRDLLDAEAAQLRAEVRLEVAGANDSRGS
jgi:hypothetical protein